MRGYVTIQKTVHRQEPSLRLHSAPYFTHDIFVCTLLSRNEFEVGQNGQKISSWVMSIRNNMQSFSWFKKMLTFVPIFVGNCAQQDFSSTIRVRSDNLRGTHNALTTYVYEIKKFFFKITRLEVTLSHMLSRIELKRLENFRDLRGHSHYGPSAYANTLFNPCSLNH